MFDEWGMLGWMWAASPVVVGSSVEGGGGVMGFRGHSVMGPFACGCGGRGGVGVGRVDVPGADGSAWFGGSADVPISTTGLTALVAGEDWHCRRGRRAGVPEGTRWINFFRLPGSSPSASREGWDRRSHGVTTAGTPGAIFTLPALVIARPSSLLPSPLWEIQCRLAGPASATFIRIQSDGCRYSQPGGLAPNSRHVDLRRVIFT